MKHLQTFEKYYVKGDDIYHYTSLENALDILKSGELKYRRMGVQNKYSSNKPQVPLQKLSRTKLIMITNRNFLLFNNNCLLFSI